MTLYDLTTEYAELLEKLSDPDYEGYKDDINEKLAVTDADIEDKADAYAKFIKTFEAEANAIKTEEERLYARRKAYENRAQYMKKALEGSMVFLDKKKFKTTLFSFGIQKNAPSLDIATEEFIPAAYYIPQEPKLDKISLLEDMKTGKVSVEGVGIKQTESLRIR